MLAPDLAASLGGFPARDVFADAFPVTPDGDPLSRTMRYERTALLPALLLTRTRARDAEGEDVLHQRDGLDALLQPGAQLAC